MKFLKFIFAMFLSFVPGFLGLIVTPIFSGGNLWYDTLNVSVLTPAGWVFSVVWTILYILIGVALFLIMIDDKNDKTSAYTLFGVNLVLNALWSYSFFGTEMPKFALLVLAALIIIAIFMARAFYRINRAAFWLVTPYIVWLFFAFYLNGMIIYLN